MMSAREEKVKVVEELQDKFGKSVAAILTDYRGLNVSDITELRKQLREAGVEYKVVKNTLTRLAVREHNYDLDEFLEGPTAVAFSFEDPVAPAKILVDFAKQHKELEIKAGIVEGKVVGKDVIDNLAKLPSREELLAKVVGAVQSPLYGIVGVLQGPIRDFVYTLQAIQDKKAS